MSAVAAISCLARCSSALRLEAIGKRGLAHVRLRQKIVVTILESASVTRGTHCLLAFAEASDFVAPPNIRDQRRARGPAVSSKRLMGPFACSRGASPPGPLDVHAWARGAGSIRRAGFVPPGAGGQGRRNSRAQVSFVAPRCALRRTRLGLKTIRGSRGASSFGATSSMSCSGLERRRG